MEKCIHQSGLAKLTDFPALVVSSKLEYQIARLLELAYLLYDYYMSSNKRDSWAWVRFIYLYLYGFTCYLQLRVKASRMSLSPNLSHPILSLLSGDNAGDIMPWFLHPGDLNR